MTVDTPERRYGSTMGFNPFREQDKTVLDLVLVVVTVAVAVALVLWAMFSG